MSGSLTKRVEEVEEGPRIHRVAKEMSGRYASFLREKVGEIDRNRYGAYMSFFKFSSPLLFGVCADCVNSFLNECPTYVQGSEIMGAGLSIIGLGLATWAYDNNLGRD